MTDMQQRFQRLLDAVVDEGHECGLQVAVYRDGQLVVDAWAGVADSATGRPVDGETLFPVFSVSKGIAATVMHLLVERGLVNYDTRVAEVWPEFAGQGKAATTLRHVLAHTAGLPFMPEEISYTEMSDWTTMCALLARMTPDTPPGSCWNYHALTYGWLVGEIARRVSGRTFGELLAVDICCPLGLTGLFIGIPDAVASRVAVLEDAIGATTPLEVPGPRGIPAWMEPLTLMMNRPDTRRACLPSATGIMSARALARTYAALLPGGVDGIELLPPARVHEATREQALDNGPLAGTPVGMGLGYQLLLNLGGAPTPIPGFGHGGHGGANGFADPNHRLAVGFTKTRCTVDNVALERVLAALYTEGD